jgi:hypothetical protein
MAYEYLARERDPLQIGAELTGCRDAVRCLVKTPWAQQRIAAIANALLRQGTLSGEQVCEFCQ